MAGKKAPRKLRTNSRIGEISEAAAGEAQVDQCSMFTAILDRLPYSLYVSDPNTYDILYMSNPLRSMLGTGPDGRKCYEILQGRSEPCEFCTNSFILKTRQPHTWEHYNAHLKRHFLITDQIIKWPDGRDVRFESAVDITDQKKLEIKLAASKQKYRTFIENSAYGFFIMDPKLDVTYFNKVAEKIYGMKFEPGNGISFSEVMDAQEQAKALANLRTVMEGGNIDRPGLYTVKRKDGQMRTVEIQTFPIWDGKTLEGFHGTVVDVTEKLEHERKLRENSEFLNAVIKNSSEGIFVVDDELNYALINPASGRILGHDPEKWIGKKAGGNKHPDDAQIGIDSIMKVMSEGSSECEIRVMSSEGKYHLLYIRYTLMNLNGKEHILGIVTDITERKKAEEALRESEEKYRNLFEFSPEAIILLDLDQSVIECNNAAQKLLAEKRDQMIGKPIWSVFALDESDIEYYRGVHESIINGSRIEQLECEVTTADNRNLWVEIFPTLISKGSEPSAMQLICRDITERKAKEDEVKKKFLRFNLEPGWIYLARESRAAASVTAFKDLITFGFPGLMISRAKRRDSAALIDLPFTHVHLSDADLYDSVRPSQKDLLALFSGLSRRQAVMIDCMDYIISKLGEKKALNLIQDMGDIAWKKKLVVIVSFDPKSVSETAMNQFAKEMEEMIHVESLRKLSEKHLEIVEFIGNENAARDFPTYSGVGEELNLSKPTVRTRIRELKDMGIVSEKAHGRTKRLELTEKGKSYMAQ